MPPEEIVQLLHNRPFEPFRLYLTDGSSFEVRHPEMALVTRRTLTVGITEVQGPALPPYERSQIVSLLHVIGLEPFAAPASPPSNGG